jgi:dienelactone hydrolase
VIACHVSPVSPRRCGELIDRSRARGGDIQITFYPGATHDFDDPGAGRSDVPANASAAADAIPRAIAFFADILKARAAKQLVAGNLPSGGRCGFNWSGAT